MIKLILDELTGKIFGYTKVSSLTQIYKEDVLVDESTLVGKKLEKAYWKDGEVVNQEEEDEYFAELARLAEEITENEQQDGKTSLLDELVKGKGLLDIVRGIKTLRENREALKNQRTELLEGHKQELKEHYLARNHQLDAALEYKYYSALILLIKHENRYLQEWLDWHLALGFDHIYIYDNGTTEKVQDIIDLYPEEMRERITVVDWSGHHTHIQQDAYNHFLKNHKQDVRWGLFIDSDEFLRFTDESVTDVNEFLRSYEDYTEVWGYEVEYDANGQEKYEDKPARERFTRQTDTREGFYYKNFLQVNRIDSMIMHYAYYDSTKHLLFKNEQSNKDLFVIDHYYTKSWEEWCWKIKERGGADPLYHKALWEFFEYNPDMKYLDTGEMTVQAYE